MNGVFFDGWTAVLRTIVTGLVAYICLIALLRVSGKRTLSKMNAFDWIVTVSLGSALASILISKDVALAEGITGLMVLIALQFALRAGSLPLKQPQSNCIKNNCGTQVEVNEPAAAAVSAGDLCDPLRQHSGGHRNGQEYSKGISRGLCRRSNAVRDFIG